MMVFGVSVMECAKSYAIERKLARKARNKGLKSEQKIIAGKG